MIHFPPWAELQFTIIDYFWLKIIVVNGGEEHTANSSLKCFEVINRKLSSPLTLEHLMVPN